MDSELPVTPVAPPVISLQNISLAFGKTQALKHINLEVPGGRVIGLIGPDGVGKSTLLSLVSGARKVESGIVTVLGGNISDEHHRKAAGPRIAYMPQGLGKNLYMTLSVFENIEFFGRLFGHSGKEIRRRSRLLLTATGLAPFEDRPAGKLSGGMKQKLGLCCALIHDPELLILDEPTTGVDPLSRRQFWDLINQIRAQLPGMSVIVATAYMEEAAAFDWLVAIEAGEIMATGTMAELLEQTGTSSLDAAFIALLPPEKRAGHTAVEIEPRDLSSITDYAIEAEGLTKRFGNFTAVNNVSFHIPPGEIFGFLGSNGCGKTTTMKMLTGLLSATEGTAKLFGHEVDPDDIETRRHVGYMSQLFSLYEELTVRQNLVLHGRLFNLPKGVIAERVDELAARFDLVEVMDTLPGALPLGIRQRMSLAVAMIHKPDILILDEPTSGVDPIARDELWHSLIRLSREDNVTIFISTHFMNEAERCDRISLMHAGDVLVSDTPRAIVEKRGADSLEQAFIQYLEDASEEQQDTLPQIGLTAINDDTNASTTGAAGSSWFDLRRLYSYAHRENLELRRDPIRATLALLGSLILMVVVSYGITMDVEDLSFAVLDHDQSITSNNYVLEFSGSRYFVEKEPLGSYEDMDQRMRAGNLGVALEIPPGFGRDIAAGRPVEVGAWIDAAMPQRAETARGYLEGLHAQWLAAKIRELHGARAALPPMSIETRYRYNPDVRSLVSMVPAIIPLLLMLIPAMLTSLSVVREKELGSIVNLYVTPVTRLEFLLGKQLPYIILALVNFALLMILGVVVLRIPFTGSLLTMLVGATLYVMCSTALGLLISTFTKSQIAAIFATAVLTILPVVQFSGLIDPVSSLEGFGALIGQLYPASHFITISRGTFSKALGMDDLYGAFLPLAIGFPVILTASVFLLKKQA